MSDPKVIVALDYPNADAALAMADQLSPELCRVKVGKELFTVAGPQVVRALMDKGFDVFLDLKFHDIPNTVAAAVKVAAQMGVWMVNVHASGGSRMMQAARQAVDSVPGNKTHLIAVTVLTSMSPEDLAETGIRLSPLEHVLYLAKLAKGSGMDGVVCSAQEARALREHLGDDFLLVTPGIRLPGDAAGDQRRVVTPCDALANGSSYLVMGRSITGAADPVGVLQKIDV
ncbi:MAG TPA: orotidine-5'-phosphate decarboxylase [Pseudomonadales bacterium]|nr:orotidine-5'-phosphate decarboxylase [Pseudomonadales bacterium]